MCLQIFSRTAIVRVIVAFALCFLIAGCVSRRCFIQHKFDFSHLRSVVVFPFENYTEDPYAAQIITANFITELRLRLKSSVIDAQHLTDTSTTPKAIAVGAQRSSSLAQKIALAQAIQATHIILGKVNEFRYKRGLGEEPVVGINVEMISVSDAVVNWNASISVQKGFFNLSEQSLSEYSQKAVKQVLQTLH